MPGPFSIATRRSDELLESEVRELRALMLDAFADDEHGGFEDDDWQHALGGAHFIGTLDGRIVSHAAVVERSIHVDGRPLRTGYVEAVATAPHSQRRGYGTLVMRGANELIENEFQLGALGTGSQPFYERLGWKVWRGPSYVRTPQGEVATPDEDGYIMVLRTRTTPPIDMTARISCEERAGDDW
jgi:aminoglycoside 2'-N-acetyltransferase I